jgi:hypothetical protein
MTVSGLPKQELADTLQSLRRLLEASQHDYQIKTKQYEDLSGELNALGNSIRSLMGSIAAVERALGLPPEEQSKIPAISPPKNPAQSVDATETVMRIVASHHNADGITINGIAQELKEQNVEISREYLHTILNRKKNHQKKLTKVDGNWFLTDKGMEEVGMVL